MARAFDEWNPLAHETLLRLAENLLWVRGSLPGMSLKRVMTAARLEDGGLVLHSAIALEASAQKQLEAFGEPRYLIVPNPAHRLDAPASGEILIPVGGESRGMVSGRIVSGRSWLVLPAQVREYTLIVGNSEVMSYCESS